MAAGINVATKKDKKSNDCDINIGNNSTGSTTPISILLEKSGDGNKRNPLIKPMIIDIYAVFSFKLLL